MDRTLTNKTSRGRIIDVYFKPEKVWCEHCDATNCQHVKFAMHIPEVQKILQEKRMENKGMKTLRISDNIHRKLAAPAGTFTAQISKMQTYKTP